MEQVMAAVAQCLTAIATIMVCVLAIWGDRIKAKFFPPILDLVLPDIALDRIACNPPRYYVHLRVHNAGKVAGRSCRVILRDIQKRVAGGSDFVREPVPIPLQFTWSPSEIPPLQRDIPSRADETIDLGFVAKQDQKGFCPQFYVTPAGHDYNVPAQGTARYFVNVVADNCDARLSRVFEVSWDGQWDDNPDAMRKHLVVSDVSDRAA